MNETVKQILEKRLRTLWDDYEQTKIQLVQQVKWVEETHAELERFSTEINDIQDELVAAVDREGRL